MRKSFLRLAIVLTCALLVLPMSMASVFAETEPGEEEIPPGLILRIGVPERGAIGTGRLGHADPGEEFDSTYEFPDTFTYSRIEGVHKIGAKPDEGSYFVEWQNADGSTYSTEPELTVEYTGEKIELKAIFVAYPSQTATFYVRNGAIASESYDVLSCAGVMQTLMNAGKIVRGKSPEGLENIVFYNDEEGKNILMYSLEGDMIGYGMEYHDISYDITDEVRAKLQDIVDNHADEYNEELIDALQNIIDYYKTVEIKFAPLTYLTINAQGGRIAYTELYSFEEPEDVELDYGDDPIQSVVTPYVGTYLVGVEPDEGYTFVKWTLNGKDYSTDPVVEVTLDDEGDLDLKAIFSAGPGQLQVVDPADNAFNTTIGEEDRDPNPYITLTKEEEQSMNVEGLSIDVFVEVQDITNTVPSADKALIEKAIGKNDKVGAYLDIKLYKQVEDKEKVAVGETPKEISLTMDIPEALIKEGRTFSVYRVHDGKATKLTSTRNENSLTFKTDKFSTYALVYTDKEASNIIAPKTGAEDYPGAYITLLVTAMALAVITLKTKTLSK
ncbi:MAG: hypothetical protein J6H21_03400 [Firmicutes bacterium]|nr:hypothetical protein [Bacillota bacterium]